MSNHSNSKSGLFAELERLRAENVELKSRVKQLEENTTPPANSNESKGSLHYLEQEFYSLIKNDDHILDFFQKGAWDGVWYWDLENPEHEWMSPDFWRLLGYEPKEKKHLAAEWQSIIYPEDLEISIDNFNKHCADPEQPYDQLVRYRHKDGSMVWVRCRGVIIRDAQGRPIRMVGAHNDFTRQKKREQDLIESEKRFRLLTENVRDIIWQRDADLRLTYISPSVEQILGFTPKEAIAAPPEQRFPQHSLEMLVRLGEELHDAITNGQASTAQRRIELEALHRDGHSVWLEIDVHSVTDEEGRFLYLMGVSRDVTDRKRAEESIHQQTKQVRNMFDNVPVGMFESTPEGKFIYVNRAIAKMLKHSSPEALVEEVNKSSIAEALYVEPDRRQKFVEEIGGQGSTWKVFETQYRCKDGDVIDALLNFAQAQDPLSGKTRLFGFVLDITDRKRAEMEITTAKAEFESIFNNSQVGIMLLKSGRFFHRGNQRLADILGYKNPEEMAGLDMRDVHISEKAYTEFEENYYIKLAHEEQIQIEYRLRRKDGSPVWCSLSGKALNPKVLNQGVVWIIDDLEPRKKLEDALLKTAKKADAANSAKSEFLANMSHEIRTPLNGLMGMLQLMGMTSLDLEQKKFVDHAIKSSDRLLRLLTDILDLSRIEAGKLQISMEVFDFNDAIDGIVQLFAPSAKEKGLDLRVQSNPSIPPKMFGDVVRLQQVLSNLVGNAIKFTNSGFVEIDAHPLLSNRPKECWILFSISDTGIGIRDDLLEQLFAPFTQAEGNYTRRFQGAGLGLTISKRLVDHMGGSISVMSEEGIGSTFFFSVPFKLAESEEAVNEVADEMIQLKRLKVIVAEDDETSSLVAMSQLEKLGHKVRSVENGEQLLAMLQKESFDLILMDVQMPIMNGVEATKAIRSGEGGARNKDIHILAMTAYAMAGDKDKFIEAGMDGYVSKPLNFGELENEMDRVLGKKG